MKIISLIASIWLCIEVLAMAQASGQGTPPPSANPPMTGTLTTMVLGESISIDVDPAIHRTFRLAEVFAIVSPDGNVVDGTTITPGRTVTLHFMREYDDVIVDRIFLEQD